MTRPIWWIGEEENGEVPINSPEWGSFIRVVVRMDNGKEIPDGYDNARLIVRSVELLNFAKMVTEDRYFAKKLRRRAPALLKAMKEILDGIDGKEVDDTKAVGKFYD